MIVTYSIYIVDDEQSVREGLAMSLEEDYQVKAFSTGEETIDAVKTNPPDLILLDIGLPGMNGIEVLKKIKGICPDVLVIMITAYEDINTVVSAMKLGAYDYIMKPLQMEGLEATIRNALETIRLRKEIQFLQEKYLTENFPCFIGESNAIQDVMELVGMVAKSPNTPILILGETGTGKELIARAIHLKSPNFKGPLVTVNCAAIPRDLIESELFGYEKGAFSGAKESGKKGLIEEAVNGTLFLDEVGDLSLEAQAKLLRFLEEGEFYRIGGIKKLNVKTRVVSATNKDLDSLMEEGLFRKDLYFRLGVVKVQVPSLNKRQDCIIPLSKHFLFEFSRKFNKKFTGISLKAKDALKSHNWTGNVRELKNIIERGVLTSKGPELTIEDLGIEAVGRSPASEQIGVKTKFPPIPRGGIDIRSVQESLEKYYIEEALKMTGGNETKAAKLLKINHHTFRYHRKRLRTK
ncbi:MAG: sigma-54-dependent Fis family transcriptional regulator [Deltaproteobacteria bacterium]|nr:MAG: sigma-54-dependent Fis family transcriptional regulator [Deltaproteobacteria bacterium]